MYFSIATKGKQDYNNSYSKLYIIKETVILTCWLYPMYGKKSDNIFQTRGFLKQLALVTVDMEKQGNTSYFGWKHCF